MRPLTYSLFRWLLITSTISEVGSWIQLVGSDWFVTSQTLDPLQVSLLSASMTSAMFLFGVPGGIMSDVFGRRRMLLVAQLWMMGFATVMTVALWTHRLGPWSLIFLTFALFAGMALQEPSMHAAYAELVPRRDLPAAVTLHGAEFNFARVVGPWIGGAVIRQFGLVSAFIANILSYVALISFLVRWKSKPEENGTREPAGAAIKGGLRYLRFSPELAAIVAFASLHTFFAATPGAFVPILARTKLHLSSQGFGALISCLGLGAFIGSFTIAPVLGVIRASRLVPAGLILSAASFIALSRANGAIEFGVLLALSSFATIVCSAPLTAILQSQLTPWARGRVMGISLLIFAGSASVGMATCGWVARQFGAETSLFAIGVGFLLLTALAPLLHLRLVSDSGSPDGTPVELAQGYQPVLDPVLVLIDYNIPAAATGQFTSLTKHLGRLRRRDGAMEWNLTQDLDRAGRFVESFVVESWAEHQFRSGQLTGADRDLHAQLAACNENGGPAVTLSTFVSRGTGLQRAEAAGA